MKRFMKGVLLSAISFAALVHTSAFAGVLPEGYLRCHSITVTDPNQYIDTGYKPTLKTDIEAHFEVPHFNQMNPLYWTRELWGSTPSFGFILTTNTRSVRAYRISPGSTSVQTTLIHALGNDINLSTKYSGNGSVNTFTVNGETVNFAYSPVTQLGTSIFIFRLNDNGTLHKDVPSVVGTKLYSFKIIEDGEEMMNLVPCFDVSSNVAGVYDTVNGKFYSNASSSGGSFGYDLYANVFEVSSSLNGVGEPLPAYSATSGVIPGMEISVSCGPSPWTNEWGMIEYTCTGWKLYDENDNEVLNGPEKEFVYSHPSPAAYRRLEWQWAPRKFSLIPKGFVECECITVTDNRQYIDTKYKPKVTTDIQARYEVSDFSSLNSLYWVRHNKIAYGFVLPPNADTESKVRAYRISDGTGLTTAVKNPPTKTLTISTDYAPGVNTFTLNGETLNFANNTQESLNHSIYLFRLNEGGAPYAGVSSIIDTKLYSFKIIESGVVVRDFVPCLRTSDATAGLYDVLNDDPVTAFYTNADSSGSATFGFEAKSTGGISLTVSGSPAQPGTPFPGYGITNLVAGVEVNAQMPHLDGVNYLTGEERRLLGWTLTITRGAEVITTTSTEENISTCSFTPQEGDKILLVWHWTASPYGEVVLPDEYEECESLSITPFEQSQFAFVDPKFVPSLDDQIVLVLQPDVSGGNTFVLLCSRENATKPSEKPHLWLYIKNGRLSYMCGTGSDKENLAIMPTDRRISFAFNRRGLYMEGELVDEWYGETDQDLEWPLIIGASYAVPDSALNRVYGVYNSVRGHIFAFKAYAADGTPKVNLRPCTRKSDGAKGLYDTVRNIFCPLRTNPLVWTDGDPGNLGTPSKGEYGAKRISLHNAREASISTASYPSGEFYPLGGESKYEVTGWTLRTVSAEGEETVVTNDSTNVNEYDIPIYYGDIIYFTWKFKMTYLKPKGPNLPARYSESEWMDFANTYVKTDYIPKPNKIKMETTFQLADTNLQCIFCARANVNSGCYTALIYPPNYPGHEEFEFRVKNAVSGFSFSPPLGERLTLCSETNTVWVKGKTEKYDVGTFDRTFTAAGGELMFGATYQLSTSYGNYSSMRFYGSKIWEKVGDDYQLVHDYRPCFDRFTGVSGLYDIVEGVFFPNAAGAHFNCERKKFLGTAIYLR